MSAADYLNYYHSTLFLFYQPPSRSLSRQGAELACSSLPLSALIILAISLSLARSFSSPSGSQNNKHTTLTASNHHHQPPLLATANFLKLDRKKHGPRWTLIKFC